MPILIKTNQLKKINAIIRRSEDYIVTNFGSPVTAEILFWDDNEFRITVFHSEILDLDLSPLSSKNKDVRHFVTYSERKKIYEYEKLYIRDIFKRNYCRPYIEHKILKLIKGVLQ